MLWWIRLQFINIHHLPIPTPNTPLSCLTPIDVVFNNLLWLQNEQNEPLGLNIRLVDSASRKLADTKQAEAYNVYAVRIVSANTTWGVFLGGNYCLFSWDPKLKHIGQTQTKPAGKSQKPSRNSGLKQSCPAESSRVQPSSINSQLTHRCIIENKLLLF